MESIGTFDKLWYSPDNSTWTALEFLEGSSIGLQQQFVDPNGIRGSRLHVADRVREGNRSTAGQLMFAPSPLELNTLLYLILGGTKSGNNIPFAEEVPAFYLKTSRDGTRHLYDGLKVNNATFSVSEGSLLTVALNVLGVDEASGGSEPAATIDATGAPYIMSDAALTVGGTSYQFRTLQITVDNHLEVRFNNSITPSSIRPTDATFGIQLGLPYGDASALYGTAVSGVAAVAAFTNSTRSCTFNLAGIAAPKQSLPFGGRASRTLPWSGIARKTGSTNPLSVDNDSTV